MKRVAVNLREIDLYAIAVFYINGLWCTYTVVCDKCSYLDRAGL